MQRSARILTSAIISGICAAALPVASATNDGPAGGSVVAGTWSTATQVFTTMDHLALQLRRIGNQYPRTAATYGRAQGSHRAGLRMPWRVQRAGPHAIVEVDFYSLTPTADANAAHSVPAHWTPVTVSANHPNFIGHGDCELIHEMKDILSKNFSLRDLNYRTDCMPYQMNTKDFSVKAEILQPLPATVASAAQG